MQMSASIAALAAALSKAQGEIDGATKGKINPAFKSKYADLASVWDAIRAPMAKNGLAVVQAPNVDGEGRVTLCTTLMHSSGEWLSSCYPVNPTKPDPQGVGSAVTYARRYSLMAMVGVCPEDDDGNAASGRHEPAKVIDHPQRREPPKPQTIPIPETDDGWKMWAETYRDALKASKTSEQFEAWVRANVVGMGRVASVNAKAHKYLTDFIDARRIDFMDAMPAPGQPDATMLGA
jgi:hypothetical protein